MHLDRIFTFVLSHSSSLTKKNNNPNSQFFNLVWERGYGSISSQLKKLAVMKNKDMHGDVEIWLEQRLNILEQLDSANSKTEL